MNKPVKRMEPGVRMAALAAAGHYFVFGRHAGDYQEKISGISLQLKGEVLQRMAGMKTIDQRSYNALIDKTARRYARRRPYEVKNVVVELKNAWNHIGMTLK